MPSEAAHLRGAVFFDRDGVLNVDVAYAHRPGQIAWTPGAFAAVRAANAAGRWVFVVTNQSGVARGMFTTADVEALHAWMAERLAAEGARVDAWRYCPHLPEIDGPCPCRKPAPGMLLDLMAQYPVDPAKSFLIGDQPRDLQAAAAAGVRGLHYEGGDLEALVREGLALTSEA